MPLLLDRSISCPLMNATPKEEILFHEHGREEISLIND
jgi:hypothetical protein